MENDKKVQRVKLSSILFMTHMASLPRGALLCVRCRWDVQAVLDQLCFSHCPGRETEALKERRDQPATEEKGVVNSAPFRLTISYQRGTSHCPTLANLKAQNAFWCQKRVHKWRERGEAPFALYTHGPRHQSWHAEKDTASKQEQCTQLCHGSVTPRTGSG